MYESQIVNSAGTSETSCNGLATPKDLKAFTTCPSAAAPEIAKTEPASTNDYVFLAVNGGVSTGEDRIVLLRLHLVYIAAISGEGCR